MCSSSSRVDMVILHYTHVVLDTYVHRHFNIWQISSSYSHHLSYVQYYVVRILLYSTSDIRNIVPEQTFKELLSCECVGLLVVEKDH